jgi:hypothetical protein
LVCSFKTTGVNYRLFNVAEPTRPPKKNNISKGDGTPEKVRGGFSVMCEIGVPLPIWGVGVWGLGTRVNA